MAIADENYFDWPVLPEAPSSLRVSAAAGSVKLIWQIHGGNRTGVVVERQIENQRGDGGNWERVAKLPSGRTEYIDSGVGKERRAAYRVRALNEAGESAYSNIVRLNLRNQ